MSRDRRSWVMATKTYPPIRAVSATPPLLPFNPKTMVSVMPVTTTGIISTGKRKHHMPPSDSANRLPASRPSSCDDFFVGSQNVIIFVNRRHGLEVLLLPLDTRHSDGPRCDFEGRLRMGDLEHPDLPLLRRLDELFRPSPAQS